MTDLNTIKEAILSIPPKAKLDNIRPEINWYYQPYLNIYDWLTKDEMLSTPLTFKISGDGELIWKTTRAQTTIEYCKNDSNWTSITSSANGTSIIVNDGDAVRFRGNNSNYFNNYFSSSDITFDLEGNIMSLIDKNDFANLKILNASFSFMSLFQNCTGLISAKNLMLPATTLSVQCYYGMFEKCTNLIEAPILPATTLEYGCYMYMFSECTNLTVAPELPATVLSRNCYEGMFKKCTKLTTAPILPATTLFTECYMLMFVNCTALNTVPMLPAPILVTRCYSGMFQFCVSLKYIKCLAVDVSANDCTSYWLNYASSSGIFAKSPEATSWSRDTSGIPSGWTITEE